jgi:hypothetical protein
LSYLLYSCIIFSVGGGTNCILCILSIQFSFAYFNHIYIEILFCLLHVLRGNYFPQAHNGMLLHNQCTEQCGFVSFTRVISDYGNLSWFWGCIDTLVHHKAQDNVVLILGGNPPYGPDNMVITFP